MTAPARDPALDYYFHANLPDKEYVVINDSVIQNDVAFKSGVELGLAPVESSLKISGIGVDESVEKQISLGGQSLANQQRISW